jgi:hypothetical protein
MNAPIRISLCLAVVVTLLAASPASPFPRYDPNQDYCGPMELQGKVHIDDLFRISFKKPCYNHDKCYNQCKVTCKSKATCDSEFRSDMRTICEQRYPSVYEQPSRAKCYEAAETYYQAVKNLASLFGGFNCGDQIAPSRTRGAASGQASVHEQRNFGGWVKSLGPTSSGADLRSFAGSNINDAISSIRVGDYLRCEFYEHANFSGKMLGPLCPGDYPDLSAAGWNDRISSLKCWTETDTPTAPGGQTVTGVGAQGCSFGRIAQGYSVESGSPPVTIPVQVNDEACTWSVTTDAGWITLNLQGSVPAVSQSASTQVFRGSKSFSFSVQPNNGSTDRSGTIRLVPHAGQPWTGPAQIAIHQSRCRVSLKPASRSLATTAASGTVAVAAAASCSWSAASQAPWISIGATRDGTGTGNVPYSVGANNSYQPRTGTIRIGDKAFTVSQSGCTTTLAPISQLLTPAGTSGSFTVKMTGACPWSAASQAEWITITSGGSGTGNGTVQFRVQPNRSAQQRQGFIRVADQTFTVTQKGMGTSGTGTYK